MGGDRPNGGASNCRRSACHRLIKGCSSVPLTLPCCSCTILTSLLRVFCFFASAAPRPPPELTTPRSYQVCQRWWKHMGDIMPRRATPCCLQAPAACKPLLPASPCCLHPAPRLACDPLFLLQQRRFQPRCSPSEASVSHGLKTFFLSFCFACTGVGPLAPDRTATAL